MMTTQSTVYPIPRVRGADLGPDRPTGLVAMFTDNTSAAIPQEFTVTIDWGDGSPQSAGTVTEDWGSGVRRDRLAYLRGRGPHGNIRSPCTY